MKTVNRTIHELTVDDLQKLLAEHFGVKVKDTKINFDIDVEDDHATFNGLNIEIDK